MKKLIAIAALTILTSTAWAHNNTGNSYSGNHISSEKAHAIQLGSNEFYASVLISQPADHQDKAGVAAHSFNADPTGDQ